MFQQLHIFPGADTEPLNSKASNSVLESEYWFSFAFSELTETCKPFKQRNIHLEKPIFYAENHRNR